MIELAGGELLLRLRGEVVDPHVGEAVAHLGEIAVVLLLDAFVPLFLVGPVAALGVRDAREGARPAAPVV